MPIINLDYQVSFSSDELRYVKKSIKKDENDVILFNERGYEIPTIELVFDWGQDILTFDDEAQRDYLYSELIDQWKLSLYYFDPDSIHTRGIS